MQKCGGRDLHSHEFSLSLFRYEAHQLRIHMPRSFTLDSYFRLGWERVCFISHVAVYHRGKLSIDLEEGTEAENMEECCYLPACSGLMFSYLSNTDQVHLPKDGIVHSGLGSSTWVINQEDAPTGMP